MSGKNDAKARSVPFVRSGKKLTVGEIPEITAYEAGFLTVTNASWRTETPVCDRNRCNGCLNCYLYCPEGCVYRDGESGKIGIDYDFCKGCGICAKLCRKGAIIMEKHGK